MLSGCILQRLHKRLQFELKGTDPDYIGDMPTVVFMRAFFDDVSTIQMIANLSDQHALRLLAKKFRVDI